MPATTGATRHSSTSLIASIAPTLVRAQLWRYRKDFDGGDRGNNLRAQSMSAKAQKPKSIRLNSMSVAPALPQMESLFESM
jgi:hypothetical protein